jgi:hypothetical protein
MQDAMTVYGRTAHRVHQQVSGTLVLGYRRSERIVVVRRYSDRNERIIVQRTFCSGTRRAGSPRSSNNLQGIIIARSVDRSLHIAQLLTLVDRFCWREPWLHHSAAWTRPRWRCQNCAEELDSHWVRLVHALAVCCWVSRIWQRSWTVSSPSHITALSILLLA